MFAKGLVLAKQQITYDYQPDAPELPAGIESDIKLASPCPMLRTRHLRSPRGERRILVNAGLETINVKFAAPAGFNAWYDPSSGKHFAAKVDGDGMIILIIYKLIAVDDDIFIEQRFLGNS